MRRTPLQLDALVDDHLRWLGIQESRIAFILSAFPLTTMIITLLRMYSEATIILWLELCSR